MASFISEIKMSESDSSDFETIERVSSLKSAPKSFDKVPDDMDFKLKLKTEDTTQKLIEEGLSTSLHYQFERLGDPFINYNV